MDVDEGQEKRQEGLWSILTSRRIGCITALIAFAYIMFLGFLPIYKAFYANSHPTLSEIEKLTSLKFPEGAKLLSSDFSGSCPQPDRVLEADIEINATDIGVFTSHPGAEFTQDDQPANNAGSQNEKDFTSVVFRIQPEKQPGIVVAIDQVSKKRAVVHLECIRQNILAR